MNSTDSKFTCNAPTTIESVKSKNAATAAFDVASATCAEGLEFKIKGENFRNPKSVEICDTPCKIQNSDDNTITCKLGNELVLGATETEKKCTVSVEQSSENAEMKANDADSFTCLR